MRFTNMNQVICMKWGKLYGPEYVNILYSMVRKNVTGDLRFVCLTDNYEGINGDVELYPCPKVSIPQPHCNRGWRKLSLYDTSENLFGLTGDWLYLDLDVIVTGCLDRFFEYKPEQDFIVMKNWTQPGKNIGNTSVYRFKVGADSYLLKQLINDQDDILNQYNNSQTYISRNIKHLTFWPDEWCVLFKTHCVPSWPKRFWMTPFLPEKALVVAFPGVPNPHQAARGEWPATSWKKLYKHIRPTPWIEEYWNENN